MKVLLLNAFQDVCYENAENHHLFLNTPLGLSYVYTYAKQKLVHADVQIYDAHADLVLNAGKGMEYNWKLLAAKLDEIAPDVIGISACFYRAAKLFHETCARIKAKWPSVVIVAGGNYPTDGRDIVLDDKNVDYVVLSEGELPFVQLVECLMRGGDPSVVGGIGFVRGDKKVYTETRFNSHFLEPADLPIPDRAALPMHLYGRGRNVLDRLGLGEFRSLEMTISRGCPYKCTFCNAMNYWGQEIRYRETESVLDEMEILKKEYGATVILINDDNFLLNRKKVAEIARGMIDRKLDLKWVANGGSNVRALNDESFLDLVVESGFALFNLAIECRNQETLKRLKKPVKIDEVWSLVELVRRKYPSLWLNGHFIVGLPFETKQDVIDTHQFGLDLGLDWSTYSVFKPFPNTELHDYCVEKGLIKAFDWNFGDDLSRVAVNGPDWTAEWLLEFTYLENLRVNFLENPNLERGKTFRPAWEQALRDFHYVTSLTNGTHALAYRQSALVANLLGRTEDAKIFAAEESRVLAESPEFRKMYAQLGL